MLTSPHLVLFRHPINGRRARQEKRPTLTKNPSFSRKNILFQSIGITAAQIPVFGIDLNTGIPVLGIGIGSFS